MTSLPVRREWSRGQQCAVRPAGGWERRRSSSYLDVQAAWRRTDRRRRQQQQRPGELADTGTPAVRWRTCETRPPTTWGSPDWRKDEPIRRVTASSNLRQNTTTLYAVSASTTAETISDYVILYGVSRKTETKMFFVTSFTKLVQFGWNLVHRFSNKSTAKLCKLFHLTWKVSLHYLVKPEMLIGYMLPLSY